MIYGDVFECENCQTADSIQATQQLSPGYKCSECVTGTWHGLFEQERYSFEIHGPALNKSNPLGVFISFS